MTLQTAVSDIVKAESRGLEGDHAGLRYGSAAALAAARASQLEIEYGLVSAKAIHAQLLIDLARSKTQIAALQASLTTVKSNAESLLLDSAAAGDGHLSALSTLNNAVNAAILSLSGIPALTFATFRDE